MQVTHLTQAGNQNMLGNGPKTVSRAGCMLTCFTMAANTINGTRMSVNLSNDILRQAGCFVGSGLDTKKVCQRYDLKMRRREVVIGDVFDAIEGGHALVMLGIDYKDGASSGFSDADHFVLAYALGKADDGTPTILAADPATGKDLVLTTTVVVGGRQLTTHIGKALGRASEAIYLTGAGNP